MAASQSDQEPRCPLCHRPMVPGASLDRHHWVPKSQGGEGTEWNWMHKVCHRKIHAVLDEKALATAYATAVVLRAHPEIAAFLTWIQRKHPEYVDHHKRPRT